MNASTSGSTIVRDFLSAMEQRDLLLAKSFLADGFTMTFPGGAVFDQLEQLVEWSKERYLSVGKSYDRFDECTGSDDGIVYCYGTLHGVWLDGTKFGGIRFIDRFTVRNGKLADQLVWNDMAEIKSRDLEQ